MLRSADSSLSFDAWLTQAGLDPASVASALVFGDRRGVALTDVEGVVRFACGPAARALGLDPCRHLT